MLHHHRSAGKAKRGPVAIDHPTRSLLEAFNERAPLPSPYLAGAIGTDSATHCARGGAGDYFSSLAIEAAEAKRARRAETLGRRALFDSVLRRMRDIAPITREAFASMVGRP